MTKLKTPPLSTFDRLPVRFFIGKTTLGRIEIQTLNYSISAAIPDKVCLDLSKQEPCLRLYEAKNERDNTWQVTMRDKYGIHLYTCKGDERTAINRLINALNKVTNQNRDNYILLGNFIANSASMCFYL